MATLEQIDEKLDKVENTLIEIKTVLLGKNGDKGLVGQVQDHDKTIKTILIILAALIGSSVLGGSAFGVVKLLMG